MRDQLSSFQLLLRIGMSPGPLNKQHDERTINWALALRNNRQKLRPHDMRDVQRLAGVCVLLTLAEEKHVHEIGVNHVQIPDTREESLAEDTVKDVQIGRQLIGFLPGLRVDLPSTVGLEGLLVSGGNILVRTKTDWSLEPLIFHLKQPHEGLPLDS